MEVTIRQATMDDLDAVTAVEAECFPEAEAAKREDFENRMRYYPDHFWLMFAGAELISFVDGFVTDEENLRDEMYENAQMHDENGKWQMIFGVNTVPAYRNRGCAGKLIRKAIEEAELQGRKGLVLTCKHRLVEYYSGFGFKDEGVSSESVHGGAVWHQMRLVF